MRLWGISQKIKKLKEFKDIVRFRSVPLYTNRPSRSSYYMVFQVQKKRTPTVIKNIIASFQNTIYTPAMDKERSTKRSLRHTATWFDTWSLESQFKLADPTHAIKNSRGYPQHSLAIESSSFPIIRAANRTLHSTFGTTDNKCDGWVCRLKHGDLHAPGVY